MIVVTGAAGFIGFHVARRLLALGREVVGFDNLNDYYTPALKRARLAELEGAAGWRFVEGDLCDAALVADVVRTAGTDCVIHLAAQAGVRWSLENPSAYVQSNLVGFGNLLEACRHAGTGNLIYASSSSVYGANTKTPFAVGDTVDHPVSLYAATKKANELMAHSYAHLFGLPCTGLRFFTVYGPWGRPDMAYWKFTDAILEGRPIDVFGGGLLRRDFTYIDDIVEAIVRMADAPASANPSWSADRPDPATSSAPWRVYNIGNHTPVTVNDLLATLEDLCGRAAVRIDRPKPPGDVEATYADVESLSHDFDFRPGTPLRDGLARFVEWYRGWQRGRAAASARDSGVASGWKSGKTWQTGLAPAAVGPVVSAAMKHASPFFDRLHDRIVALGGLHNAHLHLDRAGTLDATRELLAEQEKGRESQLSLATKHSLIPAIHESHCYDRSAMAERVNSFLDRMVAAGTTRAATVVDTTADRVGLGLLEQFLEFKRERTGAIDLAVGAYSPLGFRDDEPWRWDLFVAGARIADFVGLLPERDERRRYPEHIGFEECCRRGLLLAAELGKPVHLHVDQLNHPSENLSERLVRVFRELDLPVNRWETPWVWLVHVISPSTYEDRRFQRLAESLAELNLGVISCPSSAIGTRQHRAAYTPTSNSIARVLEMLAAGLHVRIGSGNICDIISPAGTADLLHELHVLCNAVRCYDVEVLAKLGAGLKPDAADRERLHRHLHDERAEIARLAKAA